MSRFTDYGVGAQVPPGANRRRAGRALSVAAIHAVGVAVTVCALAAVSSTAQAQLPAAQVQMNAEVEIWRQSLDLQECFYVHHAADMRSYRSGVRKRFDMDPECVAKIPGWQRAGWGAKDIEYAINDFDLFRVWRCVVASSGIAVDDINRVGRQVNDRANLKRATTNASISRGEYMLWISDKYPLTERTAKLARACANDLLDSTYSNDTAKGWTTRLLLTPLIKYSLFPK